MDGTNNMAWVSDAANDLWKDLNNAVHDVFLQVNVAAKFLPVVPWPDPLASTVPTQVIDLTKLVVDERASEDVLETSVKFDLTKTQAGDEARSHTARTLASNGARLLALARDLLIFQGLGATALVGRGAIAGHLGGHG